jgi:hypothetical protein
MLGKLPPGSKGFDCDTPVSAAHAAKFVAAGYRFVVRYVNRLSGPITGELTPLELATLLRAGLAVMVVQHVANPGWHPTGLLGKIYGTNAARETFDAGVTQGATVWCDLEEVSRNSSIDEIIDYCNAWYDAVRAGGFEPGLYVGYGCGLTGWQLYQRLKFKRYWSAYNLNGDNYPAVRGVQMRQFAATSSDRVPGIPFEFDVNLIAQDAKGDSPVLLLAGPLLADAAPIDDADEGNHAERSA